MQAWLIVEKKGLMSGSVVAVCKTEAKAKEVAETYRRMYPGATYWIEDKTYAEYNAPDMPIRKQMHKVWAAVDALQQLTDDEIHTLLGLLGLIEDEEGAGEDED